MSHLHKIVFTFCAMMHSCYVYTAQVQKISQVSSERKLYSVAEKLGYFRLWEEKNLPQLQEFLKLHGAKIVNLCHPESKRTLLMRAANNTWSIEGFKTILELPEININAQSAQLDGVDSTDCFAYTALMVAVNRQQMEKVELLLKHGADAKRIDSYGNNALDYAVSAEGEYCNNPTIMCSIVDLLLAAGIDINERKQQTYLVRAITSNKRDIVAHLLSRGANITSNALDAALDKQDIFKLLSDNVQTKLKNNKDSLVLKALSLQAIALTMSQEAKRAYDCYKKMSDSENNKVATLAAHVQQIISDAHTSLNAMAEDSQDSIAAKEANDDDYVTL